MENCMHEWEIVIDKVIPAPIERFFVIEDELESRRRPPKWMFMSTSITVLKCLKCGELDKTIVESPQ
jgi:hypothetical protein